MYYVYIVECSDGSLYAGITTELERRVEEHQEGRGAKYTRSRLPVKVVYVEKCANRSEATRRELEIKRLSRKEKEQLIENG